jgi:hypothetical protein
VRGTSTKHQPKFENAKFESQIEISVCVSKVEILHPVPGHFMVRVSSCRAPERSPQSKELGSSTKHKPNCYAIHIFNQSGQLMSKFAALHQAPGQSMVCVTPESSPQSNEPGTSI